MSSITGNSDPYLYPGTNVLKNLRGLTDPKLLERFETRRSHRRIAELIDTPVPGGFDVAHLKAIHRHIFQDVYQWAGQFRTVNNIQGWPSLRARGLPRIGAAANPAKTGVREVP